MEMCKICKEVYHSHDMQRGICQECYGNGKAKKFFEDQETEKQREKHREQIERNKAKYQSEEQVQRRRNKARQQRKKLMKDFIPVILILVFGGIIGLSIETGTLQIINDIVMLVGFIYIVSIIRGIF